MADTLEEDKICSECGVLQPATNFVIDRAYTTKLKRRPDCKSCQKKQKKLADKARKQAPLKPEVCDCCGKIPKKWQLDHCHKTGNFRGWICLPCNRGIGMLGDYLEDVEKAVKYLKRAKRKYG